MRNLSIARVLIIFGLLTLSGLLAALVLQTYTLGKVRIGSDLYSGIVQQKDLVADVLPPPLFVVEAYALAYEARIHPERRPQAVARIKDLKRTYDARKEYWNSAELPAAQREQIDGEVIGASEAFWDVVEKQYIPNADGSDEVLAPIFDAMAKAYHQQEAAALKLSQMAQAIDIERQDEAKAMADSLGGLALTGGVTGLAIFVAGLIFFYRRAVFPLGSITDVMGQLASQDFSPAIPYSERGDEVGRIAKALAVFKEAGLEQKRLQEEATLAADQRRRDRELREAEMQQRSAATGDVVSNLGAALKRLSECDLSMLINAPFTEEFEQIRQDFNQSLTAIQETLEKVRNGAAEMHGSSAELSEGADNMARRSEQQAAALEEASAALEQITATVSQLNGNAHSTRALVGEARAKANQSIAVVEDAVSAMRRIESSAGEIGNIISVIDEIAFQTNLLALNAGVEAARAGDAGKGFAVVAQEVRELAQRSAKAAKEIKTLIENSSREVEDGVDLVGKTGEALEEINRYVTSIDTNVGNIVIGIQEQAVGLKETSTVIQQLDSATQQNAAMAEETSALSKALSDQAAVLSEQVQRFKLQSIGGHGSALTQRRVA